MSSIVHIKLADIMPEQNAVFRKQQIPERAVVPDRIHTLLAKAMDVFTAGVQPAGMVSELSIQKFETIFTGESNNATDALIQYIFPHADNLALFAVTLGANVTMMIEKLFKKSDGALGVMLDAVASSAAEKAVEVCETFFFNDLSKRQNTTHDSFVLSYSPGYCGWHVSGQKKLFRYLQPEKIGISLNDSCLMTPLKSVTGLLVAGKKEIHLFDEGAYSYCSLCKDRTCGERMKKISTRRNTLP